MKAKDLHQKIEQELKGLLAEKREKLRELNFDIHLKQSKNVRDVRKLKKDIARILTILKVKSS